MVQKQKIKAPSYLSAAAKKWWDSVVAEYVLESHHLKLLEAAAGAWDRAEQARKLLKKDGLVVLDRFKQQKAHPASLIERDSKSLFSRLVRELGLDVEGPVDSRPPRLGGQKY